MRYVGRAMGAETRRGGHGGDDGGLGTAPVLLSTTMFYQLVFKCQLSHKTVNFSNRKRKVDDFLGGGDF